ncbi:AbgT family transporter [Rhodococcus sp. T2V]|uniref:AbgT family transporter n=1 Tax=Rhodococcus sp. T2V TaxID=3034164 RepID=UPI0023E1BDBF|nr:AbgT family transporter [Rhodococcus sp. T2V]MDF3309640.1 AbgT family transporter [Rhodococcus sp. T2V]
MTTTQIGNSDTHTKLNGLYRLIVAIERCGNKLPHPFWLFWILAGALGVASLVLSLFGVSVMLPDSDEVVVVQNLLSFNGIAFAADSALDNFAKFPPLAVIVVVFLGVSIAEKSGFLTALLRVTVVRLPARWVTFAIVFSAMLAHVMSDSAFLVMLPLGALAFRAAGRSPVLGVMVAYTATAVATAASPMVTPNDALRTSLTSAAAQLVDPNYVVTPVALYYFSAASSIFLAVVITLIIELVLARRPDFAAVSTEHDDPTSATPDGRSAITATDRQGEDENLSVRLAPAERRGLRLAGVTFVLYIVLVSAMLLAPDSQLIGEGGSIVESVVVENIAVFISLLFAILGFVYGRTVKSIPSLSDIPDVMSEGISRIAPVIVLFFAVSQFLAYFNWTGIGKVLIVGGANLIDSMNAPPLVILLTIIPAICVLNMVISSGSAMWSILAPVLVPMMMYVGMSPEAAMVAFQIGDSVTNPVTPMLPYFVLALGYIQRYWKNAGIGTLMSFTVPISFVVLIAWSAFFIVWYTLGIPLGPGVDIH